MISLILPPKDQISRAAKMLADEFGTASNIKSRVNRLSVLSAITSTQQRLKLFSKVPPNGLVIYCGTILTDDNKEKKVNIDFEPFKPINTSLYLCDNKFHTEVRRPPPTPSGPRQRQRHTRRPPAPRPVFTPPCRALAPTARRAAAHRRRCKSCSSRTTSSGSSSWTVHRPRHRSLRLTHGLTHNLTHHRRNAAPRRRRPARRP